MIEVVVALFVVAKRGEDSDVRRAAALFPPPDTRTPPASLSMNYELTRFRTTLKLPLHHQIRAWWSLSESKVAVAFRCRCLLPAGSRPPQRSTRPESSPSPTFWLFLPFRQNTMERRMDCYRLMISDIMIVFWGVGWGTMTGSIELLFLSQNMINMITFGRFDVCQSSFPLRCNQHSSKVV